MDQKKPQKRSVRVRRMTTNECRLDDEARAQVRDCLKKARVSLPRDRFEPLIRGIETSIDNFRTTPVQDPFREAHEALRQLWELSHEVDPSVFLLRNGIRTLPRRAVEYIDDRARIVSERLFPDEPPITRFQGWAINADPRKLLQATRVLSADGARFVEGRSRGAGKRSGYRREPVIMGETRGAEPHNHRGGAPTKDAEFDLVMFLAVDWWLATGHKPRPGRSDKTGFGDLVHSVFQLLRRPEGSATYALRRYWTDVRRSQGRPGWEDFPTHHGEEL
jgi:hypothetical protein